jgi:hypothetical protein
MEVGLLMTSAQRGQAIIAVMVVMLILFALAGAVAIGAESLLGRPNSASATTDDFRLRSALSDSVAQVAGQSQACSAAPAPSPLPTPTTSPIPSSLSLSLPSPDAQAQLTTECARMNGVAINGVQRVAAPGQICKSIPLGLSGRVAVLFDVHTSTGAGGGGWAYLDDKTGTSGGQCPATPPSNAAVDGSPCITVFDRGWTQVALTCDIPSGQTAQLHIRATATSPAQVFAAQQNPQGASTVGAVYLLAVQTPIASTTMEEALLFVSSDHTTNRLLYEAPLLP